VAKWTDPLPKYGPTAQYGECEVPTCRAAARVTCVECDAHVCLAHADHAEHADHADHADHDDHDAPTLE
jgi:hypothetical protein